MWPHLSGSDGDWTSSYGKLTFFHNVKQDGHEHGSLIILRVQHSNKGMSVSNMHPICLFGWLAGLLIGCFVCWRCGSFIAGCLVSWLALIRWIVSLVTWLVGFSISWLACWLVAKGFSAHIIKTKSPCFSRPVHFSGTKGPPYYEAILYNENHKQVRSG